MIEILKRNKDKSFEVVCDKEVALGDEFPINSQTKVWIMQKVNEIHEQRKERGTYADESKRRMWAKVS